MEKEENRKWFCQAARLVSGAAIHVSETRDRIGEFPEDECAETLHYAVNAAQRAQEFIDAGASHAEASRAQAILDPVRRELEALKARISLTNPTA